MSAPSALACPASLKGVLSARAAAAALAAGFAEVGAVCDELPLADGGEGTVDALSGRLAGATVVEAASVIPFDPARRDVTVRSSRPLGELIASMRDAERLIVGLGGTANMDAGAGLLEVLDRLPAPRRSRCRATRRVRARISSR
jgi:glycerate 2-kinase